MLLEYKTCIYKITFTVDNHSKWQYPCWRKNVLFMASKNNCLVYNTHVSKDVTKVPDLAKSSENFCDNFLRVFITFFFLSKCNGKQLRNDIVLNFLDSLYFYFCFGWSSKQSISKILLYLFDKNQFDQRSFVEGY